MFLNFCITEGTGDPNYILGNPIILKDPTVSQQKGYKAYRKMICRDFGF